MNPLNWVRTAFRNAALGGLQDAVEHVANDGIASVTVRVELPALPAPEEEKPKRKRD